jgi:hypothetical protein
MKAFFKFAIVLGLGLVAGLYVYRQMSLDGLARLKWPDGVHGAIGKALTPAKVDAAVVPVDPVAAALSDEERDYRIAQRTDSLDGWRSFLAAHPSGIFAASAMLEVDGLLAAKAPAPATAEVSNAPSPDARASSDVLGSASPSPRTAAATVAPDEICKRDGERLERLRSTPTSDEVQRFANELGCEKLRPKLLALMESLSAASPAPAAAPSPSANVNSALGPTRRATAPASEARWATPSRRLHLRRYAYRCAFRSACHWRASFWPPILLALFGDRPGHSSAFRRTFDYARPNGLHGR